MAIAYQNNSGVVTGIGTSATANKPAGSVEGDLLVGFCTTDSNETITRPSGWTDIISGKSANNDASHDISFKICGASEPATYQWTWGTSERVLLWIARFTGNFPANPITGTPASTTGTNNSAVSPSITPNDTPSVLIAFQGGDLNKVATTDSGYPSGYTGIFNRNTSGGGNCFQGSCYRAYTGTSATGTAAWANLTSSTEHYEAHFAIYETTQSTITPATLNVDADLIAAQLNARLYPAGLSVDAALIEAQLNARLNPATLSVDSTLYAPTLSTPAQDFITPATLAVDVTPKAPSLGLRVLPDTLTVEVTQQTPTVATPLAVFSQPIRRTFRKIYRKTTLRHYRGKVFQLFQGQVPDYIYPATLSVSATLQTPAIFSGVPSLVQDVIVLTDKNTSILMIDDDPIMLVDTDDDIII